MNCNAPGSALPLRRADEGSVEYGMEEPRSPRTDSTDDSELTTAPTARGPRRSTLISTMGLAYDPFSHAFSEGDPAPDFQSIFVDPTPSLLDKLQRRGHLVILADYGLGKTATRLALEYVLRSARAQPPCLCVTYTPSLEDLAHHGADDLLEHMLRDMAAAAAIDLVVQFIERLDDLPRMLSAEQSAALARQARALPQQVQKRFQQVAREAHHDGALWRGDRAVSGIRPVVRHVATTRRWRLAVEVIAAAASGQRVPQPWDRSLADARTLGFGEVVLLVDAIDEQQIDPAVQTELIAPLLAHAPALEERQVSMKCFMPAPEPSIARSMSTFMNTLTSSIEIATIERGTQDDLLSIVHERLEAASASPTSYPTLDWFKRDDIAESLEVKLAQLADGSPRRMMELVSAFLDYHSEHGFLHVQERGRPWITRAEWQEFLARVEPRSRPSSP